MEMSSEENKGVHQSTSTIYELMHLGRSETKSASTALHPAAVEIQPDPAGWYSSDRVFKISHHQK